MRKVRSGFGATLIGLLLVVLMIAPGMKLRADGPGPESVSTRTVEIPGLSSQVNNVTFAFDGKYSLVAPFEASKDSDPEPFKGDNHYLYIVDAAGNTIPKDLSIQATTTTTFYYPTHVIVAADPTSSTSNTVFVRATAWNPDVPNQNGEAIVRVGLDTHTHKGSVAFDSNVVREFPIYPVSQTVAQSAMPTCFGLSAKGNFVLFTNGGEVSAAQVDTGVLTDANKIRFVSPDEYIPLPDPTDKNASTEDYFTVTDIEVDQNNIVSVLVNSRKNGVSFSHLYFYQLLEDAAKGEPAGTFSSLAEISSDDIGAQIAPGSKAATSADGKRGYFATTDGSLWSVELSGLFSTKRSLIGEYASIGAPPPGVEAQPRNVQVDSSGKTISVVRQGGVLRITRPTYGKHGGRITRPTYAKYNEVPGVVVVQLDGNGSVAGVPAQYFGTGASAISNTIFSSDAGVYFAASNGLSGSLMSLDKAGHTTVQGGSVPSIGQITSADASTIVGIQDFDVNVGDPNQSIVSSGGLVFMSFGQASDSVNASASALTVSATTVTRSARAGIRRPCSINH